MTKEEKKRWTTQIESWVSNGLEADSIREIENYSKSLAMREKKKEDGSSYPVENISTSQLRKFFGAVKAIELQQDLVNLDSTSNFKQIDVLLLIPALAYSVGREKDKDRKDSLTEFYEIIKAGIHKADTWYKFQNLVNILEAIVAYHKFYEVKK